jgi:hypothetical protein
MLLRRQKSGGSWIEACLGKLLQETLSGKNPSPKKELVEWLKV